MRAGDELPPLEIAITRTLIVAGAIASRDFQDVHHDAELARAKGSPDIFMNILTTNGLVGRYVTDCFGPAAVLRRLAIRLGAPNYPLIVHFAAATLWSADRADHVDVLEHNLHTKVLEPDFCYLESDGRWTAALLCALTGRNDEARRWIDQIGLPSFGPRIAELREQLKA